MALWNRKKEPSTVVNYATIDKESFESMTAALNRIAESVKEANIQTDRTLRDGIKSMNKTLAEINKNTRKS